MGSSPASSDKECRGGEVGGSASGKSGGDEGRAIASVISHIPASVAEALKAEEDDESRARTRGVK